VVQSQFVGTSQKDYCTLLSTEHDPFSKQYRCCCMSKTVIIMDTRLKDDEKTKSSISPVVSAQARQVYRETTFPLILNLTT
jgi:hypothetical protein